MFYILVVIPWILNILFSLVSVVSSEHILVFQDLLILLATFMAAVYAFQVHQNLNPQDEVRDLWRHYLLGMVCIAIGEVVYFWYETIWVIIDPFPNLGDFLIVLGYLLFLYAGWRILCTYKKLPIFIENFGKVTAWALSIIFIVLVAVFVIYPAMTDTEETLTMRLLAQVYPVIDLIGFGLYIRLFLLFLSMGNSQLSRPWLILTVAFVVSLLADSTYTFLEIHEIEGFYIWVNLTWYTAYACMAIAFHQQKHLLQDFSRFQENPFHEMEQAPLL